MKHFKIKQHDVPYPIGANFYKFIDYINDAVKQFDKIKDIRNKPVNIICRGSSGMATATLFAERLTRKKIIYRIIYLYKEGEKNHGGQLSPFMNAFNVIIDDIIATGKTIKVILEYLEKQNLHPHCLIVSSGYKDRDYVKDFFPDYLISHD